MQTARVTDVGGGSENPHAFHISPHNKVKVWHTQWAQNETVHIFSKKQQIHTAIQSILTLFFTELAEKYKKCSYLMQDCTMAHTENFSITALIKDG